MIRPARGAGGGCCGACVPLGLAGGDTASSALNLCTSSRFLFRSFLQRLTELNDSRCATQRQLHYHV